MTTGGVPDEAHGTIVLAPDACTSCMICVRECPVWCIELTSHDQVVGDPAARRPRTVSVLDSFTIDFGLCMFCGICVEVCPFDALWWSPQREGAVADVVDLRAGIDRLDDPDRGRSGGAG